jgi:hypothetical protein
VKCERCGSLAAERRAAEEARKDLFDVVNALQRKFQPGGSPPPGGPLMLSLWIMEAITDKLAAAEKKIGELRQQNRESAERRDKECAAHLKKLARQDQLNKYTLDVLGEMVFDPVTRVALNSYSAAQKAAVSNLIERLEQAEARERKMTAVVEAGRIWKRETIRPNSHADPEGMTLWDALAALDQNEKGEK